MIDYVGNIKSNNLSIYDPISYEDKYFYIPIYDLEYILSKALIGISLVGLPLRTRSKFVKSQICQALGYPVPTSFKKTRPRFIGQNFDVYTQKSNNVQIWNEEVDANRRYVFLQVNQEDVIGSVRVITGEELVKYDKTGTLTKKFQAKMRSFGRNFCSQRDTSNVENWIIDYGMGVLFDINPNQFPKREQLLRITEIYKRLLPMVGQSVDYIDALQERNRGAELHTMICTNLGYSIYEDDGKYPDIANQLLEIKLQTSPTIDLGLHSPEDGQHIVSIGNTSFYSQDIRYAIFDGQVQMNRVLLKNLYLVTGAEFSKYFPLFQGMGVNSKIQLPLPVDFFV